MHFFWRKKFLLSLLILVCVILIASPIFFQAGLWFLRSVGIVQANATPPDLASLVQPIYGTGAQANLDAAYSGGETFPGADTPFGMVQWSPDTARYAYSGYDYRDSRLRGFSLTHLSGAGCSSYGDFPFMPYVGAVTTSPANDTGRYIATFSHANEQAQPGYYSVYLDTGVKVELSATSRSGAGRFTYPEGQAATILINLSGSLNPGKSAQATVGQDTVAGWADSGNFCYLHLNTYRVYFWAQFSQPFSASGSWSRNNVVQASSQASGSNSGVYVTFGAGQPQTINVRVGISFVSEANARANALQENPRNNFDAVHGQATQNWNSWLNKIRVTGGTTAERSTFYTALYHSLLYPSIFSDVNGEYEGFDNQVHLTTLGHIQYANYSGWDIYRSEAQLLTLLAPQQASDMAQSLYNDYKQGGTFPRWPVANEDSYVQVGDGTSITIADIFAFGGRNFDVGGATHALVEQARWPNPVRPGVAYLEQYGYEPLDGPYGCCNAYAQASTSLEYASADFAIGEMAGATGDHRAQQYFRQRAQDWRNLYNPATGYLQPRYTTGNFPGDFTPASNLGWCEGNSAQYTWMVPFNLHELFAKLGGNQQVIQRLNTFFEHLNVGLDQPYAFLGNEPSLDTPWEYDYAGTPYKTQEIVRRAINTLYQANPVGTPGNDDLGEMSSWYIFSALGMYPETPGTATLVLASPLFPSITITRGSGQVIQINAPQASTNVYYVQGLKVNNQDSTRPWLPASFIAHGGTLDYTLGTTPDKSWGSSAKDAPPSYGEIK